MNIIISNMIPSNREPLMTDTETIVLGSLVASSFWTVLTGDTFIPSLGGALFATWLRAEKKELGFDLKDYIITSAMSIFIGIVAGPWVGSQLPEGDGVIGVGALITSFIGVSIFMKFWEYVKTTDIFTKNKSD